MDTAVPPMSAPPVSPLMLADRLLSLAQDAERSGFPGPASALVTLVFDVLDPEPAHKPI